ncbi:MAG: hypothetical protein C5617_005020 [ANME-2 cluster archaeon]|nr:MAG: hypothetical protein C5617_005020 [ANME-2 cluster archaeon]
MSPSFTAEYAEYEVMDLIGIHRFHRQQGGTLSPKAATVSGFAGMCGSSDPRHQRAIFVIPSPLTQASTPEALQVAGSSAAYL